MHEGETKGQYDDVSVLSKAINGYCKFLEGEIERSGKSFARNRDFVISSAEVGIDINDVARKNLIEDKTRFEVYTNALIELENFLAEAHREGENQ